MSETEFKIGDRVILKTGATNCPDMVIVKMEGNMATCKWYSRAASKFEEETFPVEALFKK